MFHAVFYRLPFICASFCCFILSCKSLYCAFCISYSWAIFHACNSFAFVASSPAMRYNVSICPSINLRYSFSKVAFLALAAALRCSNSFSPVSVFFPANSRGKRPRFQFAKFSINPCPFVASRPKTRAKKKPANCSPFERL